MPFAQINYQQKLGTGPNTATIHDVGCFLTSFSNLLERYGESVDPPNLNQYFINHGSYMAEGALHDLLGWGSISAYDGTIHPVQVGTGWPNSDNAIVKFHYRSISHPTLPNGQPNMIDHFCLVADHNGGTIVDSWDGKVKRSPYGTPVAYAIYEKTNPIPPVVPVAVPTPKPGKFEQFSTPMNLVTNKQTKLWDLSATTWAGFKEDSELPVNTPFLAVGKYEHPLGGVYFMNADQFGDAGHTGQPNKFEGINTVDLSPPPPPEPPKPVEQPKPEAEAVSVPVKVTSWKESYHDAYGIYRATKDIVVADLEAKVPSVNLGHDQLVKVAGFVTKDGQEYAVTVKSHNNQVWLGIPKDVLVPYAQPDTVTAAPAQKPKRISEIVADDIDKVVAELNSDPDFTKFKATLSPRGKVVAAVAEAEEIADDFVSKINIFKRKNK